MNQFIVRYLGNVRWWGGGMVERRRRRGRLIADRVQRARTPRDLADTAVQVEGLSGIQLDDCAEDLVEFVEHRRQLG